jgi:hypothetical protein
VSRTSPMLAILAEAGLRPETASRLLTGIGLVEVGLGAVLIAAWRTRWPLVVILLLMPATHVAVSLASPRVLAAAFNPVTLNVTVAALAAIAWRSSTDLPSASRCMRARPRQESDRPS